MPSRIHHPIHDNFEDMMIWRRGVVLTSEEPWDGVQLLVVELDQPVGDETNRIRALSYLEITGEGKAGDQVIVTAGALQKGLGTGGYAFVAAFPDRLPPDPPARSGHIVKARYTPIQTVRLGVDEQESEHHQVLREATSINGMPVIVADLHSALPAIIAGIKSVQPQAKVAYIMSDGGALPYAFSATAARLRSEGWIEASITIGQSFGGDYEAVNIYTGLLAAAHVIRADVAIVAQGPGNLGTGTPLGFSGTNLAEALQATSILGGLPVGSLRVSQVDKRPRHYGVSHHSLTVYDQLTLVPITVVSPQFEGDFGNQIARQLAPLSDRHSVAWHPLQGLAEALGKSPVRLSTMGRGMGQDATPFLAAAAAGAWVATTTLGER